MTERVLVISPEAVFPTNAGGRAAVLAQCEALIQAGFQVELLVFHREPMTHQEAQRHRDLCSNTLFVRRRSIFAASVAAPTAPYQLSSRWLSRRRARAIRARLSRPDVVVAQQEWTMQAAAALWRRDEVPILLSSHNDERAYFFDQLRSAAGVQRLYLRAELPRVRLFLPSLIGGASAVVTLSRQDQATYRGIPVRTIPYALPNPPHPLAIADRRPIILYVGALDMPHAVEGLLWFLHRVWPEVLRQVPDAGFEVAGRRSPSALRMELSKATGVSFLGEVPDVAPLYARASLFVNPVFAGSGINIKLADPVGLGIPSVTTSVGARGYEHLAEGLLVADDAGPFADACARLLKDPAEATARSRMLRAVATQTDAAQVAKLWREAVMDLAASSCFR